jgi:hypothetical protein
MGASLSVEAIEPCDVLSVGAWRGASQSDEGDEHGETSRGQHEDGKDANHDGLPQR